jgi:hypothetical protein
MVQEKITELSLRQPSFYTNFKHRVFQPKQIDLPIASKDRVTTYVDELPFHRKLGFSPLTFSALCFTFMILLWYILFTPQLR